MLEVPCIVCRNVLTRSLPSSCVPTSAQMEGLKDHIRYWNFCPGDSCILFMMYRCNISYRVRCNIVTLQAVCPRGLEDEKFTRLEQFVRLKETILGLYTELEEEPFTDFER